MFLFKSNGSKCLFQMEAPFNPSWNSLTLTYITYLDFSAHLATNHCVTYLQI